MEKGERLGPWGEKKAAAFLRRKGYHIVRRNYSGRMGEIDIIATDDTYLVFVEVKLRKDAGHGTAREFVTAAKQRRLRQTASYYLMLNPTELQPRFDVIEIYAPRGTWTLLPKIIHWEDAFY